MSPKKVIYGVQPGGINDNKSQVNDIIGANSLSVNQENVIFKIVRKITQRNLVNLIIAVNPKTGRDILQKGYLFVNWTKCRVNDFYHMKQCYNCCYYG